MKKLIVAALAIASMCGCEPNHNNSWVSAPNSASPENNGCWTDYGYNVMAKVVVIKGHEYIFVTHGRDCTVVHAASCYCTGK